MINEQANKWGEQDKTKSKQVRWARQDKKQTSEMSKTRQKANKWDEQDKPMSEREKWERGKKKNAMKGKVRLDRIQYTQQLVLNLGYPLSEATWELVNHLRNTIDVIRDFQHHNLTNLLRLEVSEIWEDNITTNVMLV